MSLQTVNNRQQSEIDESKVKGQMSKVILGIRTETAEASVVLAKLCHPEEEGQHQVAAPNIQDLLIVKIIDHTTWTAGRQLSATLLSTIDNLLKRNHARWSDLSGIVVYKGPGSFTGLRIGLTVANTAAFTLNLPIIGTTGEDWLQTGANQIKASHFTTIIMPHYGAEPNITYPKT